MAEVLTYKQIITVLSDIAGSHYQIKSFDVGKDDEFATASKYIYPVLYVTPQSGTFFRSADADSYPVKEIRFQLKVLDLVNKGQDNQDDAYSDTFQILSDIIVAINQNPYYQRSFLGLAGDIEMEPLQEWSDEEVSGWATTVSMRMKNHTAYCDLPMAPIPQSEFPGYGYSGQTYLNYGYLPLAGGVLTGPLTGTAASFTTYYSGGTALETVLYNIAHTFGYTYTTAATYNDSSKRVYFDRTDALSAYSFSLSSFTTADIYTTGGTFNNGTLSFYNNSGGSYSVTGVTTPFTGGTVAGATNFTSTLSSGGTDLSLLFLSVNDGNDITRVQPGSNTSTGGTANYPVINVVASPSFNALSISGAAAFTSTISSGGTDLSLLFAAAGVQSTLVQSGTNTYTGGTASRPTVNVSALTINTLTASGASNFTGTLSSGGTDLSLLFLSVNDGNDITRVQPGSNTSTGGTANYPTVNVVASPSFNNLNVSGTSNTTGVIQSGGTDLYSIFSTSDITRVEPGTNTYTGGTDNFPTVNVSALTINTLSVSGAAVFTNTITSGGTDLSLLFLSVNDGNDLTRVQPGLNTYTGGTANEPTINVSALTINTLSASGTSNFTGVIQSGGTDLSLLFLTVDDKTRVQPGTNTYTGGSANFPTVNVSALTINTLSVSGTAAFTGLITSGGTSLINIINNAVTGVTSGITGSLNTNGLNTYTGGTNLLQSINISGGSFDNILVSGTSGFNTLSAVTISATTFISGGTSLENIIINQINNIVGSGTTGQFMSIYTGGTTAWIAPVGVFSVVLEMWGGGGAGGNGSSSYQGGGGSGANYIQGQIPVTPGLSYSVIVGAGGLNVGAGGSSFFKQGATNLLSVSGGSPGASATAGGNGAGGSSELEYGASNNTYTTNTFTWARGYAGTEGNGSGAGGNTTLIGRVAIDNSSAALRGSGATQFGGAGAGGYVSSGPGGSGMTGLVIVRWNSASGSTSNYYFTGVTGAMQAGTNTYTGGTPLNPTINVSGGTFNNITATGTTNLSLIQSGGTDISLLFGSAVNTALIQSQLLTKVDITGSTFDARFNTKVDITGTTFDGRFNSKVDLSGTSFSSKANLSGATFTSSVLAPNFSATTISASTLYSGSTDLSTLFKAAGSSYPFELGVALSDETTQIGVSAITLSVMVPFSGTITSVLFSLSTSGSTSSAFDVKISGATIFSTAPTIDANEFGTNTAATPPVLSTTSFVKYDILNFSISTAGTGAKGAKAWIVGLKKS